MKRVLLIILLALTTLSQAEHVILTGGPSLREWEDLRTERDRHDRWWANFIRASTLRMVEIRKAYGENAPIVWMVYRDAYSDRAREDRQPYTNWISDLAKKRNVTLIWFESSGELIQKLNNRPRGSVESFDFFGHSNRYCFMFDYSNDIMGASTVWLHENDLSKIKGSIFAKNAYCKSWGCHTGESMSDIWKRKVGVPLEGAKGPTDYTVVGQGKLPVVNGSWAR